MSPRVSRSIAELRGLLAQARRAGKTIGLVPTMGSLHAGHGRLIELAREESDYVAVSIFVNPTQFNQEEDFEHYPREFEKDRQFCEALGVDCIFAPPAEEMYPRPGLTSIEVAVIAETLCGPLRPSHFRGVATVVAKLLNIVQPDFAYFGEKDAQQLAVIQRMVEDLNLPVTIRPVATVREPDGLAMSSRNNHLSAPERQTAIVLYQALRAAGQAIEAGERSAERVKQKAQQIFDKEPGARVEYFEIVEPADMQPVTEIPSAEVQRAVRIAGAIWVGSTRLIDNILAVTGER
jgi:pantoate--beta-alanine ligase